MSQQSKCDRCGAVGDVTGPSLGGVAHPPGWASLQLYGDELCVTLDLCGKCLSEAMRGAGLELAVKKAEAADFIGGGSGGGSHTYGRMPRLPRPLR